jgi:DNA-directed RNA polymerase I, II, and III subunit RPABC2
MPVTSDYLTKFEAARIIGMRTLQLSEECMQEAGLSLEEVAIREILEGTNPVIIRRYLPDGSHEDRPLRELKLDQTMRSYQLSTERLRVDQRAKRVE